MLKRSVLPLITAIFIVLAALSVHAAPTVPDGSKLEMYTLWFKQSDSHWGCNLIADHGKLPWEFCKQKIYKDYTIGQKGCALSSLAMLFQYYGMNWMPNEDYKPDFDVHGTDYSSTGSLTPANLNDWLVDHNGYDGRKIKWLNAIDSLYYNEGGVTSRLIQNNICPIRDYPYSVSSTPNEACFMANWTDPQRDPLLPSAQALLDYDLENWKPDILWMSGTDLSGRSHLSHFVLVAGYDSAQAQYGNLAYSVYNPGASLPADAYFQIPIPLSKFYRSDDTFKPLRVYRFDGWNNWFVFVNLSAIAITAHSPVEMELIDPYGQRTGFDFGTGKNLQENPMSLYYEEYEPSSLDGDDVPSEPVKILSVDEPVEGNYILKIIGTGDGPYTIDMAGKREDGTENLNTTITGTASPSLSLTYRVAYSPTGEASLSQTNQAPIANAGSNQTGEQSYEIKLDGSYSHDPDGDPIKFTWSFASKPNGSVAMLSDVHALQPAFTPDLPGTYVLQLVVNDYFTDSAPSTVTITATPVQSRISVMPNYLSPLTAGSGFISFDVNNIGRVAVNVGAISVSLADPTGVVVFTGNQSFGIGVGGATSISFPVTMPPLKFGNYTLTYTESDETKIGVAVASSVPNSAAAAFSFDKSVYRVRETANLALNLRNMGKFNLEGASLTVAVPDTGYTNSQSISISQGQTMPLQFALQVPAGLIAGQHLVNAKLTLPSGSAITQSAGFALQDSVLSLDMGASAQYAAGSIATVTVENQGSVDTSYTTRALSLTDSKGAVLYQGSVSGVVIAGEKKTLADVQIPSQFFGSMALLAVTLQDTKTGKLSYLNKSLSIDGLLAGLITSTDKDVYSNNETIMAADGISTGLFDVEGGVLKVAISGVQAGGTGAFEHFLPKTGWAGFSNVQGVAVAPDGSLYVTDLSSNNVQKYDSSGRFLTKWGGYGSGDGLFNGPLSISIGPDGSVYVADDNNSRIQKFDSSGNFMTKWGSSGSGNGQFSLIVGIAVAPDGSVYVVERGNCRIQKFDSNGNFLTKWGSSGIGNGQFVYLGDVAIATDGSVYVADSGNCRIQKFDSNGIFLTKWGSSGSGSGQFRIIFGITVAPGGSVYVVDTGNNRIQRFDGNGNFIAMWGISGNGKGQFNSPYHISATPDGSVYVADTGNYRVQKFDSNGIYLLKLGKYGSDNGEFYYPTGVALAADGSMYVADKSNYRIQKFDSSGNFLTKWGSYGSGDGQFGSPYNIALAPDGSVYVTDGDNCRIQKFDSNGNFIAKWGSYGSGNGQFLGAYGITVTPDGFVYVVDHYNNRVQKFDSNGNFLTKWGGFSYPDGIAVAPDGSVYVADTGSNFIKKFDGNGNFLTKWGTKNPHGIALAYDGSIYVSDSPENIIMKYDANGQLLTKWGGWGSSDGQFRSPSSIAMAPDGSVYVVDTSNNRIQRMIMIEAGVKTFFETIIPVSQVAGTTLDYITAINALTTTGKFYLQAELKNNLGQTVAASEYPFYVVKGNTALLLATDKKIYKPGEAVTISGEVRNLASIDATGLSLGLKRKAGTGNDVTIYTETFNVSAGGSHLFTITTTAGSEGTVTLTGAITQNGSTLAEVTDQHTVANAAVSATMTGPDTVGRDSFDLTVQVTNTGKIAASFQYSVNDSLGNAIDSGSLLLSAGETRLLSYTRQLAQTAIYSVQLSGDANSTATKTVVFGEAATITLSSAGIHAEGTVSIPVTIANTGSVDESISVTYGLAPSGTNQTKSYFLSKGKSLTDSIVYTLNKGNYQFTATSLLPSASASTSFMVSKDPEASMTSFAGMQGATGLIPVTASITNSGYSSLSGSIAVAVMNNDGKAVWRGEAPVSGLASSASQNYVVNVNTTGMLPGAYSTTVTLYSTSGQQLAVNQTQVRVLGPIFELTSLPANPSFTVGNQATLTFAVKNTGALAGSASLAVAAAELIKQSSDIALQPGEEKSYAFNLAVPENAVPQAYLANYTLTSAQSQGTTGQTGFTVVGVSVGITAALDKDAYRDGDTAILTLTMNKQSQSQDGTYMAIIRYGAYHDMQSFFLDSQPVSLTFNVPLTMITGQRLFYGVYFQSGTAIRSDSVAINPSQPDLAPAFTGPMTDDRVLLPIIGKDSTALITASVINRGKAPSPATAVSFYEGDTLLDTEPVNALNPDESANVSFVWNALGKAGNRTLKAMVDPQGTIIEISKENNLSMNQVRIPELTLFTSTDKETYKIREKVYISSLITNLTSTTAYNSLTIATKVADPSGNTVYTVNSAVGPLAPSASTTATEIWSTSGLLVDGTYTITQTATSGAQVLAQSSKTITLLKSPDFILTTDAGLRKIKQGETATYTASLTPFNGWDHEVSMSMDGLPSGATVAFSPGSLLVPGQAQAVVVSTDITAIGTHTLYLTAQGVDEGEIVSHTVPLTLDVTGFGIETATPQATIMQLQKSVSPISLASLNGYEGTVTLSVSGMPLGTKASFESGQSVVPGTVNLTVLTSKYAKPGTYMFTVTGDDGLVKHKLDMTFVLQPNPDIAAGIIATEGPGPRNDALVRLYNSKFQLVKEFTAFNTKYGASAISADIDGDGFDEIIVAEGPGPTNPATLRAFKRNGTLIAEYTAFEAKYGLTLAAADLDGDWTDELIVGMGPDPKNSGTIKILKFNGSGFAELLTQTLYPGLTYGINIASGDVNGDGLPEIITAPGPGPSNTASIKVWEYTPAGLAELSTFTAFDGFYGANIAAGDVDGDGSDEIIVGTGPDPKNPPLVRVFRADGQLINGFAPYDAAHTFGVMVSSGDLDGDGIADIITGLGPGPQNDTLVKVFKTGVKEGTRFLAYPEGIKYGVKVLIGELGGN